jgi:hypothetical protein
MKCSVKLEVSNLLPEVPVYHEETDFIALGVRTEWLN